MPESLLSSDTALRAWLASHHTPWLDGPLWVLSVLGAGGLLWLAIAAVMASWAPRLRPAAWQVVVAVLLAQLVVDWGVKPVVQRPRPFVSDQATRVVGYQPPTYSFPSGHAASSFAAATVLAYALARRRAAVTWILALLVAGSRVYIGVHYPLDVVCGAALGVVLGVLVTGKRAWYIRGSVAPRLVPR